MKKSLIFIIILFLYNPYTYADVKNIYKQSHVTGDVFSVGNYNFSVSVNAQYNKTTLISKEFGITIDAGKCIDKLNYNFCAGDLVFDHHDYNSDRDLYKSEISVGVILADISIKRYFEKTDFFIGDNSIVNVEIINNGNKDTSNFIFNDNYPNSFSISDVSKCKLDGQSVIYDKDIGSTSSISCSYKIIAVSPISFESKAKATYFNGYEIKEVVDTQLLKIKNMSLHISFKPDVGYIGKEGYININITNNAENDMHIDFLRFILPNNFVVKKVYGLSITGNILNYQGLLKKGEQVKAIIEVISNMGGNYTVEIKGGYNVEGRYSTIDTKKIVVIDYPKPKILFSHENGFIDVIIEGATEKLKEIKVIIKTPVKNSSIKKIELLADELWKVYNETVPLGNYFCDVEVEYKTQYKQFFQLKESYNIENIKIQIINETPTEPIVINKTNITEVPTNNATLLLNTTSKEHFMKVDKFKLFIIIGMVSIIVILVILKIILHRKKPAIKSLI